MIAAAPTPLPVDSTRPDNRPGIEPMHDGQDSDAFAALVILVIALALRVLVVFIGPIADVDRAYQPASHAYVQLGESVLNDRAVAWPTDTALGVDADLHQGIAALGQMPDTGTAGLVPELLRTPGYAAVLALQSGLGAPAWTVSLLQALLGAVSAVLIFGLARLALPRARVAPWVAGLLFALHPAAIGSTAALLPGTLYVFLLLAGLYAVLQEKSTRPTVYLLAGLCFSGSALMLPYTLLLVPAFAVVLLLRRPQGATIVSALMLLTASAIGPGWWTARNHDLIGRPTMSLSPAVHTYYREARDLTLSDADRKTLPATQARARLTAAWFNAAATTAEETGNDAANLFDPEVGAVTTMQRLTAQQRSATGARWWLYAAQRTLGNATHDGTAALATQLGIDRASDTPRRDALTLARPAPDGEPATGGLQAARAWAGLNTATLALAAAGTVMLLIYGRWPYALTLGGLALYYAWAERGTGDDPLGLVVFSLQPVLAAACFYRRPRKPKETPRELQRDKFADVPEFDVFGRPTKYYDKTKERDAEAPASAFGQGSSNPLTAPIAPATPATPPAPAGAAPASPPPFYAGARVDDSAVSPRITPPPSPLAKPQTATPDSPTPPDPPAATDEQPASFAFGADRITSAAPSAPKRPL